uniref:Uncharacterized protein n=1 Tax=Panagrellus redivivus TaxID=6233 RepID=A0A7E4UP57_PANRE
MRKVVNEQRQSCTTRRQSRRDTKKEARARFGRSAMPEFHTFAVHRGASILALSNGVRGPSSRRSCHMANDFMIEVFYLFSPSTCPQSYLCHWQPIELREKAINGRQNTAVASRLAGEKVARTTIGRSVMSEFLTPLPSLVGEAILALSNGVREHSGCRSRQSDD